MIAYHSQVGADTDNCANAYKFKWIDFRWKVEKC